MRVSLTEIKLRPGGKRVRLERAVEVESLYIGRGPDNDLSLQGLTTSLHHATIRLGDGHVYIEAAQGQEVAVNGLPTSGQRLAIGDEIHIGSWALWLQRPENAEDVRIEYELRQTDENARAALDGRTHLGIERGLFARRPLSWLSLGAILLGFLVLPMIAPAFRPLWTSGPVIRGHAIIENDCASCHNGLFRRVSNDACTDCHVDVRRHTPASLAMPGLDEMSCADCHLEHRGREVSLADQGAAYCVTCHDDLRTELPSSELEDASDFAKHHPAIRLAIVEESSEPAVRMSWPGEIEEDPGVDFDHHFHVSQALDGPEGEEWLGCGQCHQVEENGEGMQPVRFDRNCRRCHELDAGIPESKGQDGQLVLVLVHGDPEQIRDQLRVFFTNQVLEGRVTDPEAPQALRERLPGPLIGTRERSRSAGWIGAKVAAADEKLFGTEGCALCHRVVGGEVDNQTGGWVARTVAAVQVQDDWIRNARFSHSAHATQACSTCHPAAAVRDSEIDAVDEPRWARLGAIPYGLINERPDITVAETSAEIMIPGIATCRTCHVSAGQGGHQKVASPCSACHDFHDHTLTPMMGTQASGGAAMDSNS
jgi:hypothetical protein